MRRITVYTLIFLLVSLFPLSLFADIEGGCISQYCACDGQMHPCDFSLEECRALCGGSDPAPERTYYRDSNVDILMLSFLVSVVCIGMLVWLGGGLGSRNPDEPL